MTREELYKVMNDRLYAEIENDPYCSDGENEYEFEGDLGCIDLDDYAICAFGNGRRIITRTYTGDGWDPYDYEDDIEVNITDIKAFSRWTDEEVDLDMVLKLM